MKFNYTNYRVSTVVFKIMAKANPCLRPSLLWGRGTLGLGRLAPPLPEGLRLCPTYGRPSDLDDKQTKSALPGRLPAPLRSAAFLDTHQPWKDRAGVKPTHVHRLPG